MVGFSLDELSGMATANRDFAVDRKKVSERADELDRIIEELIAQLPTQKSNMAILNAIYFSSTRLGFHINGSFAKHGVDKQREKLSLRTDPQLGVDVASVYANSP